ncbi:MAG TPA: hypothetical protein VHZ24_02755 [Pirellulales bacterium]|jgi:hypothetical protein|nr:hypothetical protein [Pirellulales bacterium]
MNRRFRGRVAVLRIAGFALAALLTATAGALAGEPFQKFLDGLREKELYDAAMDYLAEMNASALISAQQKATIPYEEGKTLIDWAREDADVKNKTKNLDLAREKLQGFIKANSSSELAGSASMQLGNVLILRGGMLLESSARPSNLAQKDTLLKQSRDLFSEAKDVFKKAEDDYEKLVNQYKGVPPANDNAWVEKRDTVRQAFLQANLYSAAVLQEIAKTYKPGSKEHKEALVAAGDKYKHIYERWRTLMAGQLARIKQAQCIQDLGDAKTAIGLYNDILNQPDELPEFRKLKASALYRTQQCWLSESQKNPELAHKLGKEFLDKSRPDEAKQPDWLAVRYYTALAAKQLADSLTDKESGRKKTLLAEAKDNAKFVAGVRGTYREDGRVLLTQVTGKEEVQKEPTNFAEALERGQEYLDEMQAKQTAASMGSVMGNPEDKPKLEQEAVAARETAVKYFQMALKLRDPETKIEEVNTVRYYLCFLDYQAGRFYDAAVLGEFLARRYPGSAGGRPAAKIALAAYQQCYRDKQMPPALKSFDLGRMQQLATYIAQRWTGEPEAEEAWATLLSMAVVERDLKGASEYLSKLAEDSPRRGESEIKVGQAYWGAYLTEQRKEGEERMPPAKLDALVKQARELLEKGIGRVKEGVKSGSPITPDLVYGALSLAQIYLNDGKPDLAIKTLEDPEIGPLTLTRAKHAVVLQANSPIPVEAYKSALRAYVEGKELDKAQAAIKELEELVAANGAAGEAELTRIYVSMGRALEDQIKALKQGGKDDDAKKVTSSFEVFLDKIKEGEGANFQSLNWVAETFFSLGAGFDTQDGKPATGDAETYYKKSLATDEKILGLIDADKAFAPTPDSVYAVRLRIARVYRRLGKYKDAVDLIEAILKQKPMLVEAQIDGARAFMDWAQENPAYYNLAITGGRKGADGKNTIFGWLDLGRRLQSSLAGAQGIDAQTVHTMQSWFFEARYFLSVAHTSIAMTEATPDKKTKFLNDALNDIRITARLTPVLMTPEWLEWQEKFDAQAKTVQKLLNQKPDGLSVLTAQETPVEAANAGPSALTPATPGSVEPATALTTASKPEQSGGSMVLVIALVLGLAVVVVVVVVFAMRKSPPVRRPASAASFEAMTKQ